MACDGEFLVSVNNPDWATRVCTGQRLVAALVAGAIHFKAQPAEVRDDLRTNDGTANADATTEGDRIHATERNSERACVARGMILRKWG